jgi:hypothetical protein
MKQARIFLVLILGTFMFNGLAHAQGGGSRSPLSGTVVDPQGAPIPGASVQVKDENSGNTFESVTNGQGNFTIPALPAGTYTVTVSLSGFKKAVLRGNKLLSATPLDVRVKLDVGGLEETILVEGGVALVQTQSAAITQTVEVNQIATLPVPSRSALDFLTLSAGVQTPGGTANSRNSMISGLDQSAINITIDGMSIQDNFLKTTDGFFARVAPRLDMVEEVTLTTAAGNADNSGMGAAQISFTSRRGNNKFQGSVYEYYRRDKLNANTWFNNRDLPKDPVTGKSPKARLKQDTPGFRLSGPIRIPGLFDGRDKAHFFINYEVATSPSQVSRNRNILSPLAQAGIFRYGNQQINLLQLAAANGQLSTVDPVVAKLLADIRSSTSTTGGIAAATDPNLEIFTFQTDTDSTTKYPSLRLDFQLTPKHLLTLSGNMTLLLSDPDTTNGREPIFPGFPVTGVQDSERFIYSGTLRSTLRPNLINELRVFGASGGATLFSTEINAGMWSGSLANQGGYHLNINGACCSGASLANPASGTGLSSREASTKVAYNHMTWITGSHNVSFGIDFTETNVWLQNSTTVPTINFGIVAGDPAASLFTTANFPGASTANLTAARGLYSILTGRVSSVTGNARLDPGSDTYKYLGTSRAEARMREFDFFVHDTWKAKSNLTLNYGLRYALQLPFTPLNNSYATATLADVYGVSGVSNLFKPGIAGSAPRFVQFKKGEKANKTDWNNFAPSFGFAWRPTIGSGFLAAILSEEPVFRGGFSMSYNRNGMSDFTGAFGANPGILIDASRNESLGNLGAVPVLFREPSRLGAPSFANAPAYPLADVVTGDISIFDPNLKVPYSQTWSFGVQRKFGDKMALDTRYVGSRGRGLWSNVNYNESNIIENGFLNEFRLAQQNLQANIRNGRGNSFAYFGPGTGTFPLPIYLAYLNGVNAAFSGDPSRYTGTPWSDTNFTNPLAIYRPLPFSPAGVGTATGLDGSAARRANARAAGLPANFFRANPDLLGGAFIRQNDDFTSYHALELSLQRRYSGGFWASANYALSRSNLSSRYTLREGPVNTLNTGVEGGVTHTSKLFGGIDLPFGKGRKFAGSASRFVDALIGGWQLNFTAILQSGRLIDFQDVRLVGMTKKDLAKAYKLRFDDAGRKIYMLPQDIIDNTIKAFDTSATSLTGYGTGGPPTGRYLAPANGPDCISLTDTGVYTAADFGANYGYSGCGEGELVVTGPLFKTVNLGISKFFNVKGSSKFEFRAQLINAFNWANFTPVGTASNAASAYEVTGLSDGPRIAELVFRFSW